MKKTRALSAALAAALTLGLALPAGAASTSSFRDISDRKTAVNADVLRLMGVVDGTGGDRFNPNGTLTRAEFCTMVVKFMQKGDDVALNATRTIFSDVTARHWGLGYINLAASLTVKDGEKEVPLISGVGNGRFEPDSKVTLAQAATILIRVLGYSSKQAGAVWPQSYMNLAGSIDLTQGLPGDGSAPLTRAQAAQLFVNALRCKTGDGNTYYKTLGGTVSENTIILAVNVETDDGSTKGAIRTSQNKDTESYLPAEGSGSPYALQGKRGALVVNDKEEIVTFVPDDTKTTVITLADDAQPGSLKATGGSQYTMSKDTLLYTADATQGKSYSDGYSVLKSGTQVTMYAERGKIVAVYAIGSAASIDSDAVVVMGSPSLSLFQGLTGGTDGYTVQKNRQRISVSDIQPYDVVTYDSLNNVLLVSDLRLSCIYEDASPNAKAPSTIKVLGHEFPVLDSAWETTKDFKIGDAVTLLLTTDGKVAGMAKASAASSTAVGMADASGARVFLPNGGTLTLSGTVSGGEKIADQLAVISSGTRGKLSASRLGSRVVSGSFDVSAMKLNGYTVTAGVRVYEQVSGSSGAMVPVSLSDLAQMNIQGSKIVTYHTNTSNMVDYVVLDNVTGNAYQYGILTKDFIGREEKIELKNPFTVTPPSGGEPIEIKYEPERDPNGNIIWDGDEPRYKTHIVSSASLTLTNHTSITFSGNYNYDGKTKRYVGIAIGKNSEGGSTILSIVDLSQLATVSSSDFTEKQNRWYVNVNGRSYAISSNVECTSKVTQNGESTDNWFSQSSGADRLKAILSYGSSLTLYVDDMSNQVRIIEAK